MTIPLDPSLPTDAQLLSLSQREDFYIYELDFNGFTHGTTATNSFTVQTDSNFIWQYGMYWCEGTGTLTGLTNSTLVVPFATIAIQDASSGRQLTSAPVQVSSMFGTAERPFILPFPRYFRANTQLMVTAVNYDSAVSYNLKLSFCGIKRYTFAQNAP